MIKEVNIFRIDVMYHIRERPMQVIIAGRTGAFTGKNGWTSSYSKQDIKNQPDMYG